MSRTKGALGKKTLAKMNETKNKVVTEEEKKNITLPTDNEVLLEIKKMPSDEKREPLDEEKNSLDKEILKQIQNVRDKKINKCDRCHKETPYNLNTINLTYLTQISSWHRNTKSDKINLCHECCLEMSELIEKFMINNGTGVEEKFPPMGE